MGEKTSLDIAKTISEIIVSWIGVGGLVVGGVMGFTEYVDRQEEARVAGLRNLMCGNSL